MSEIRTRSALQIASRRAEIAARLEQCRDAATGNLIEIGRWLNAAKAEGIVSRGEWSAWIQEHAGMNERTAQRCMQAARELPEGSPLAKLGIAKITSLLTLPAEEREEAAIRIDAEHATSREVQDAVKAIKAERDEALRVVGAQKKQIALLRNHRNEAVSAAVSDERRIQREQQAELEEAQRRMRELEQELDRQKDLLASRDKGQARTNKLLGEAQERSEKLRAEYEQKLQEKERQIDELTDRLDDAQTALVRGTMTGGETVSPANQILSAIGALMAEAGRAPGKMAQMTSPLDEETRQILIGQARMVGQWSMQVIAACGGEPYGGI